jgi:hypothetical protein
MRIHAFASALTLLVYVAAPVHAAEAAKPDIINDYLANIGPGSTSAGEILGLSGSVINSVYSAKDLVGAIQTASGERSKGGFGISFTPARSSIDALAMPMERYLEKGPGLARVWGNTTLSYAQNRTSVGGVDYNQDAIAVRAVLYMDDASDPVVASHKAFQSLACREEAAPQMILAAAKAEEVRLGRPLVAEDRQRLKDQLTKQAPIRDALVKDATLQADCIKAAKKDASSRWNATQVSFVLGQGWIRGTTAGAQKLSLARHASLIGAWGPNESSLLNLTVRRVDRELVLDTLATTPTYKSFTLAALRYTVGIPGKSDMYALAEVSNVRKAENTVSNGAFKSALGLDMKAGENIWLEFRVGRNRTVNGSGEQTTALLNIKVSPSSGLDSLKR